MPSCLPGHTTQRDEEQPARRHTFPSTPASVKSVAAPAGTDPGLFSHLWPGGWTGSPQRGPGPPCRLLSLLRSHWNERLKRPFHGGTGKTCLYIFIISIFPHPFISRKPSRKKSMMVLSALLFNNRATAFPAPSLLFWKWTLEIFPVRDWGCSLFPITLLEVAWLHPFSSGMKTN